MQMNQAYGLWIAVTASDSVDFTQPSGKPTADALYVGTAGNVVCVLQDGTVLTIPAAAGGYIFNNRIKRVNSTNTTASNIFRLYAI